MQLRRTILIGSILLALSVVCFTSEAVTFRGECITVTDGDTIRVIRDGKVVDVHLHGIIAPDPSEETGRLATQTCKDYVHNKQLTIIIEKESEEGIHARVLLSDGTIVNEALVEAGLARWDRDNAPSAGGLELLEQEAKAAKVGLWHEADAAVAEESGEATGEPAGEPTPQPAEETGERPAEEPAEMPAERPVETSEEAPEEVAPPAAPEEAPQKPAEAPAPAKPAQKDKAEAEEESSNAAPLIVMGTLFAVAILLLIIVFLVPKMQEGSHGSAAGQPASMWEAIADVGRLAGIYAIGVLVSALILTIVLMVADGKITGKALLGILAGIQVDQFVCWIIAAYITMWLSKSFRSDTFGDNMLDISATFIAIGFLQAVLGIATGMAFVLFGVLASASAMQGNDPSALVSMMTMIILVSAGLSLVVYFWATYKFMSFGIVQQFVFFVLFAVLFWPSLVAVVLCMAIVGQFVGGTSSDVLKDWIPLM